MFNQLFLIIKGVEVSTETSSDDHHGDEHHGGIHVFTAEFARVEIPFIISMWILSASIAKIGKTKLFLKFVILRAFKLRV